MRPEEVPAEWVEKAAQHRWARHFRKYPEATWDAAPENVKERYRWSAADYLAAVLPLAQAAALAKHLDAYIEWQPRMGDSNAAFATLREMAAEVNRLREGSPS